MRIAVMGAGAVGCYYGAMLARAGHDVLLIGRPALVEAVQAHGLHLEMAGFDGQVVMTASTEPAAVRDAQLVLFCVKSGDTEPAAAAIAPYLAADAAVLSLQNGVDNVERLSARLGRPAIPAVVYVGTAMAGAGHVRHFGRGDLVIGPSPASDAIAALLGAASIPTKVSERVLDALWAKLVINCVYNALSAITQLPYGALVQEDDVMRTMRTLFDECCAVAQADGIHLPAELWTSTLAIAQNMPGQRSSTAQDLALGKRSEIDHLNGYITTRGTALGIATPVNQALHALVRTLEKHPGALPKNVPIAA